MKCPICHIELASCWGAPEDFSHGVSEGVNPALFDVVVFLAKDCPKSKGKVICGVVASVFISYTRSHGFKPRRWLRRFIVLSLEISVDQRSHVTAS